VPDGDVAPVPDSEVGTMSEGLGVRALVSQRNAYSETEPRVVPASSNARIATGPADE